MARPYRGRGRTDDKVDRGLLHEYMWKHRDGLDRYMGTQQDLAAKLGLTVFSLSHIFGEMVATGRVRKIRGRFYITDPKLWAWQHSTPT